MSTKNLSLLITLSIFLGIIFIVMICLLLEQLRNYINYVWNQFFNIQTASCQQINSSLHTDKPLVIAIRIE